MPEGDTVWRAAHHLNRALAGQVLTRCDIRVPQHATVDLSGETVHEVVSVGKHILMRIGSQTIHSHLRMEGTWHLYRTGSKWKYQEWKARAVLETAEWQAVGFELGMLDVVPTAKESEVVGHLGPDLLGPTWDEAEGIRRLGRDPEQAIFLALHDQRNIAGWGNEFVTELCFLRGYHPERRVADCDLPKTVALGRRLILANRDRVERTFTGDAREGRMHYAFGREGQPCRRCGTRIERMRLGLRETQLRDACFCPRCQPVAAQPVT